MHLAALSPDPTLARDARLSGALVLGGLSLGATIVHGGWLPPLLFAAGLAVMDRRVAAHHPFARFGWANRLTLVRAAIIAGLAGRALDPLTLADSERWLVAALGAFAVALDAADGWLARREGLASPFGARFDIEIDAAAVLVLATLAWRTGMSGWVMTIGALRYLWLAAANLAPALGRPLPATPAATWRRCLIGGGQSLVLLAALIPAMPAAPGRFACASALVLLIYSFVADARLLLRAPPPARSTDCPIAPHRQPAP